MESQIIYVVFGVNNYIAIWHYIYASFAATINSRFGCWKLFFIIGCEKSKAAQLFVKLSSSTQYWRLRWYNGIMFQRKWLLFMVRKCIRTAYTMHIHCMYSVNTQYMRITESFFYGWNQSKRCVHAVHLLCGYTACTLYLVYNLNWKQWFLCIFKWNSRCLVNLPSVMLLNLQ